MEHLPVLSAIAISVLFVKLNGKNFNENLYVTVVLLFIFLSFAFNNILQNRFHGFLIQL